MKLALIRWILCDLTCEQLLYQVLKKYADDANMSSSIIDAKFSSYLGNFSGCCCYMVFWVLACIVGDISLWFCGHMQFQGISDYWKSLREGKRELAMELSVMEWMMLMIYTCSRGLGLSLVLLMWVFSFSHNFHDIMNSLQVESLNQMLRIYVVCIIYSWMLCLNLWFWLINHDQISVNAWLND